MQFKRYIFFLISIAFLLPVTSQEKNAGPKDKTFAQERKARKKAKFEAREKRRAERAERKAVKKYHKRLQTKKVRKRMKQSKRQSKLNNDNRREPFFRRIFKKKKRKT